MGSCVALIPARGGSKGIPRKNLQKIKGIPLVGWSIRAALAATSVDRVYVSTEDDEIAAVAEKFGATVIRRPRKLAVDSAPSHPVMQHAIEVMKTTDGFPEILVLLECTSVFTTAADIDGAVAKWRADPETDIVTTVCRDHSYLLRPVEHGIEWVSFNRNGEDSRRQDLPDMFRLNGGVFVCRADGIPLHQTSYWGTIRIYEMPAERSIDIDAPLDLYMARALAEYQDQWIIVGSSISAREGFAAARVACPTAMTITTNRGHILFEEANDRPDVYHIHDMVACKIHQEHCRAFKAKGSHLITINRSQRALNDRGVAWFDEFLELAGQDYPGKFVKGCYSSCGLSGLMCLQYALNNGAHHVHLVGMEGYGEEGHYFNGEPDMSLTKNLRFTTTLIQPFVQSCIDACPDVKFTFYGKLNYTVSGRNVNIIEDLSLWNSNSRNAGEVSAPAASGTFPTGLQMC
ncbi:MAG TPA: acylneuraminate cytidylyltransferase family protein [Thermoguttaceae bacterium]|nr:acylneuraminate cytidylyltransferase family protein [Thermoguttaceae bacterium]